ncbi:MAG: hypothetical protein H6669_20475 [Ardenticatenaceae bacterium]|nr:hypothetical protein [Ardenticatenaceae bacterium]
MKRHWFVLLFLFLTGTLSSACSLVPGLGPSGPPPTPTPPGDTLSYTIPAYTINLAPGDIVPGTRLQYIEQNDGGYLVKIDGLEATKRIGDSFFWSGVIAPGVYANYNLRLTTSVLGKLPAAGPVEIIIFNPAPIEAALPAELATASPTYHNILIDYQVPPGMNIPGSTVIYEGMITQGEGQQATELAWLTGTSGYPYLALGDSLVWVGRVRENVYVRYSLRVTTMNEYGLRLSGTAELWISSN